MASRESSIAGRGRAAWVVAAVVLSFAVGGWMLSRTTDRSALPVAAPSASTPHALESMPNEAKVEAAAISASAAASISQSSQPTAAMSPTDELHKVELALQGQASPKEALEAAKSLQACEGADDAVATMYRMRDQANPQWQQLVKSMSGSSSDEVLAKAQDLQRRCQVFGPATLARRGELLKRAYEGGASDSALPYLQWLNSNGRQKVDPEFLGRLQREARRMPEEGDFMALTDYAHAFNPAALGVTPAQRQGYKEAWLRIQGEMSGPESEKVSRASMESLEKTSGSQALSAEQQREADALTARIVEAWRKRHSKAG